MVGAEKIAQGEASLGKNFLDPGGPESVRGASLNSGLPSG